MATQAIRVSLVLLVIQASALLEPLANQALLPLELLVIQVFQEQVDHQVFLVPAVVLVLLATAAIQEFLANQVLLLLAYQATVVILASLALLAILASAPVVHQVNREHQAPAAYQATQVIVAILVEILNYMVFLLQQQMPILVWDIYVLII